MAKRSKGVLVDLIAVAARLPWWVDLVLAILAYLALHPFASEMVSAAGGSNGAAAGDYLVRTAAYIGQYALPLIFLIGTGLSIARRITRDRLLAQQTGIVSIRALDWYEFERLVGEAFRRQGYRVTELGGNGPDGGIDLRMVKDGKQYLVQCKHWQSDKVGVGVVRELYGVMAAEGATGGYVVTSGTFTAEAEAFAKGKRLRLIGGEGLLTLLERSQGSDHPKTPTEQIINLVISRVFHETKAPMWTLVGGKLFLGILGIGLLWFGASAFMPKVEHSLEYLSNPFAAHAPAPRPQPRPTATPKVEPAPRVRYTPPPGRLTPREIGLEQHKRRHAIDDMFLREYKPPAGCESYDSQQEMVDCVNHRVRAKAKFLAEHPELAGSR